MGKAKSKNMKPGNPKPAKPHTKTPKLGQLKKSMTFKKKHKWAKTKQRETPNNFADAADTSAVNNPQVKVKAGSSSNTGKAGKKPAGASGSLSLRDKMMKQLNAARFRQINETLDSESADPKKAFEDDHSLYEKYHETYNELKKTWETNPLNDIVKIVQEIESEHQQSENLDVVDFGCGAGDLENSFKNTCVNVHGLDLYKLHPNTIVCDMTSVPFKNNSIDIAIFCLSLMAKDVGKFIAEANRILKMKGTLIIGEVESRFHGGAKKFTMNLKSYGFLTTRKKGGGKTEKFNSNLAHTRLNDMFIIMKFTKVKNVADKKAFLPPLAMKPSVYKKR